MAVQWVRISESPRLTDELGSGKTATVVLRALCDSFEDGVLAVIAHEDCPQKGSRYQFIGESDATLICRSVSISPQPDNSGRNASKVFEVTATYSDQIDPNSLGEDEGNPFDDPPVIEYAYNKYQVPAVQDRDGSAVVNGAEEWFDPPHLVDENRPYVTVTRNEASFNPAVANEYQDSVNQFAWAGVAAKVAKINSITARRATRGVYSYWIVTYEIEFRWQGWNPTPILSHGYRYRRTPTSQPQEWLDPSTGQPPANPILLDTDGTRRKTINEIATENGIPEVGPSGDRRIPAFLEFNFYREKDFSALNLGL